MSNTSGKGKTSPSRTRRFFTGLIFISLIGAYLGWQFAHRYQIESEVLNGYKSDNRELLVVLSKELENDSRQWGVADLISKILVDRLRQRGFSTRLIKSETVKG